MGTTQSHNDVFPPNTMLTNKSYLNTDVRTLIKKTMATPRLVGVAKDQILTLDLGCPPRWTIAGTITKPGGIGMLPRACLLGNEVYCPVGGTANAPFIERLNLETGLSTSTGVFEHDDYPAPFAWKNAVAYYGKKRLYRLSNSKSFVRAYDVSTIACGDVCTFLGFDGWTDNFCVIDHRIALCDKDARETWTFHGQVDPNACTLDNQLYFFSQYWSRTTTRLADFRVEKAQVLADQPHGFNWYSPVQFSEHSIICLAYTQEWADESNLLSTTVCSMFHDIRADRWIVGDRFSEPFVGEIRTLLMWRP